MQKMIEKIRFMDNREFAERKRRYETVHIYDDMDYLQMLFDMKMHGDTILGDIAEARTHSYQMDSTISEKRLQVFIDFLSEVEDLRKDLIRLSEIEQ